MLAELAQELHFVWLPQIPNFDNHHSDQDTPVRRASDRSLADTFQLALGTAMLRNRIRRFYLDLDSPALANQVAATTLANSAVATNAFAIAPWGAQAAGTMTLSEIYRIAQEQATRDLARRRERRRQSHRWN